MTQPDKLFKDKLENFESTAPMSAWNRIESNLDKKSSRGVWMKIAAGLALLAVAGIAWYATRNGTTSDNIASTNTNAVEKNLRKEEQPSPPIRNKEELPAEKYTAQSEPVKPSAKKNTTAKADNALNSNLVAQAQPSVDLKPIEQAEIEEISPDISVFPSATTAVASTSASDPASNVIVYTVEEVNEKFLKKNSVSATSEDKKPSGIQRLITLAADLKNTEGGLGELRDRKDDLLALNFRKNNEAKNN